jgi:putative membrane protein
MANATDQLANERTFLAYLRTALACIGFGFVVARFGLFVRELAATTGMHEATANVSAPLGVLMIGVGIALALFGGYRFAAVTRAIAQGRDVGLSVRAAVIAVIVLCALGLITAVVIYHT